VQRISDHTARIAGIALAIGLSAWFVRFLWSFDYLPGTDAYYYALQAQSLLENGKLKVPDHGAIHHAVAAIASFGMPVEIALRVMLTVVFALYQAGMAWLFLRGNQQARPAAALLWVFSGSMLAFHAIEFPALSLGVATLPMWFCLAIRATGRRMLALAGLLAAGVFAHPAAAALAVIFAVTMAAGSRQVRERLSGIRSAKRFALVCAGCVVLMIMAAIWYTGLGLRLASLRPGPPAMLGLALAGGIPIEIRVTTLAFWLLLLALLVGCRRIYPRRWLFLSVAALALPLWPDRFTGLESLGGRLSLLFILIALPLLTAVWSELAETNGLPSWTRAAWMQRSIALAAAIAVVFLPLRAQSSRGLLMADDYGSYERVVASLRDVPIPMLIAHRGLDFFYSYRLRRDAFHFDPEPDWNQVEIWRVAARITPEELAYYSPPECAWGKTARLIRGTQYVLVREDCWQKFRSQLKKPDNPDLYAEVWEDVENPSQPRPSFLRARRRLSVSPGVKEEPR
jgi:hypothetical protein